MLAGPERFAELRRLFDVALDQEPEARAAFVRAAAGDDVALADEVLALLAADQDGAATLPCVAREGGVVGAGTGLLPPRIDGYAIVRCLGSGGMGTVWEAEQQRPQRRVALKTLASPLAGERARRRFEDEIGILARLHHPGIAQVLAVSGATEADGAIPWFAMELVEEPLPIDVYAREHGLPPEQRLALFAAVCEAVQFAHQRGVLHRDLKPANVLVDRHGRPKVIDFGIARLTGDDASGRTRTGEILGTLAYMSPERLEGSAAADHVGADVYALGVLLYELLAQQPPFPVTGLAPALALALVRDHEPIPPSQRTAAVPRELDWITAKAMARDPRRRYATVGELLADLERFRRDEPLAAGPESRTYRLRKLARRHRLVVLGAAIVAMALVLGLLVAWSGWRRVAVAERAVRREAAMLAAVNAFQERILRGAHGTPAGRDVRLADVVAAALRDLDAQQGLDPAVEIGLRNSIGTSYLGLGDLQQAERQLRAARALQQQHGIGAEEPIAIAIANNLGVCLETQGRLDEASRELRLSLTGRLARHGARHAETGLAQHNLVAVLLKLGRPDEALPLAQAAVGTFAATVGERDAAAIAARGSLAKALSDLGRDEAAEAEFAVALAAASAALHPDHPGQLALINDHATHLRKLGRHDEYLAAMQQLAAARERLLGPAHPSTLAALNNLAVGQQDRQDHAAAEATLRRIVAARDAAGLDGGFDVVATGQNLTAVLRRQRRLADAEVQARAMVALAERSLPDGHWLCGVVRKELGACLRERGDFAAAEAELLAGHAMLEASVGATDARTQKVVAELVLLYAAWQRPDQQEDWARRQASAGR